MDFEARMVSKLYINVPSRFIMPEIMRSDTFFVILAHTVPEIFYFMVFKIAAAAILNIGL